MCDRNCIAGQPEGTACDDDTHCEKGACLLGECAPYRLQSTLGGMCGLTGVCDSAANLVCVDLACVSTEEADAAALCGAYWFQQIDCSSQRFSSEGAECYLDSDRCESGICNVAGVCAAGPCGP